MPDEGALSTAVDLRPPSEDPWADIAVPAGWDGIAEVAHRVAIELGPLTEHIVECIAAEIPSYLSSSSVPVEDLSASVFRNLEMMLVGIAENRGPREGEVHVRRELGHRRALQGLAIGALIQAYHIGYRELWQALVRSLPPDDTETATQLLTAATTVWRWVHEVTDAIADAHQETVRSQEAHIIGARQRFTELMVTGDLEADEVVHLCTSIGFDPDGQFRVAIARAGALDGTEARRLQTVLNGVTGVHAAVARGPQVIITSQNADEHDVSAAALGALDGATFGVGMLRDGLDGARHSLGDAERALGVAVPGTVARFADEWLWATLMRAAPRLYEVLAPGADTAVQHPHLSETVLAFADSGFSVSETARQLTIHPNTVAYRLERWHALTGWDPRTFPGLTRSLAALRLSTE